MKNLFLKILIASVSLSAAIGIVVILIGNFGELETKVLLSTLTITLTSLLGLACGAYFETGRGKYLPSAGIAFTLASAVLWLFTIWSWQIGNEYIAKGTVTVTFLAVACAHLSLVSMARFDARFRWCRPATQISVWLMVSILVFLIWTEFDLDEGLISRIIGVLGVIIGALTVITPVLHKLSSAGPNAEKIDAEIAHLRLRIEELERQKNEAGDGKKRESYS